VPIFTEEALELLATPLSIRLERAAETRDRVELEWIQAQLDLECLAIYDPYIQWAGVLQTFLLDRLGRRGHDEALLWAAEHSFRPFVRELGGMGVRERVEALAGRLRASGSTFWVDLALVEAPAGQPGREHEVTVPRQERWEPAATVLYVEDNLSNFTLIERVLVAHRNVKLLPAMQGRIGLDLAREHHPDLILLDLHLPDIHGAEVLGRLRAEPETREIPVIVISADASQGQIERLRAAGAREYLTKPLDIVRFLKAVDDVLSARHRETVAR